MKRKDVIRSLIRTKQDEIPFDVKPRELELPLDSRHIISVTGVRRCGKSSLMMLAVNRLVSNGVPKERILWIGFDDERLYDMATDELDDIVSTYMEMYPDVPLSETYMFFDEIQQVDKWELFIMRLFKSYCKNIFISGSNSQMLSSEISTTLRGWPLEYEVYPLSFREYCSFMGLPTTVYKESDAAKVKNAFLNYVHNGGFPEVVLSKEKSIRDRLLQGYFNTMLFRDLIERYGLTNHSAVRFFLKRLLANVSKPTSINGIFNELKSQGIKVGKDKLYELADYVCEIFMFFRVPRYDRSIVKESGSPCKYYCVDNGMRTSVLLPQSGDEGKLLENAVLLHLKRCNSPSGKISYYMGQRECDFVVQCGDVVAELLQVTWNMEEAGTRKREIDGIAEASKVTGCKKLTIVTYDVEEDIEASGCRINMIPAWRWMLGL